MSKKIQENLPGDENYIFIHDGKVFTNSLYIAKAFNKEHKNILRAIENLEVDDEFRRLNFELGSYKDRQGQDRPLYLLNRDGFTVLVMGFTGKEAMSFKIEYIKRFNLMEQDIKARSLPAPQKELTKTELAYMVIESERKLLESKHETQIALNMLDNSQYEVNMFKSFTNSEGSIPVTQFGIYANKFTKKISHNKIQGWLVEKGVLNKKQGKFIQYFINPKYKKYFEDVLARTQINGESQLINQVYIFTSGFHFICELAIKDGFITLNQYKQMKFNDLQINNKTRLFEVIKDEE